MMPRYNVRGMYQYTQSGSWHKAFADVEVQALDDAAAMRKGLAQVQSDLRNRRTQDAPLIACRRLLWSVKPQVILLVSS